MPPRAEPGAPGGSFGGVIGRTIDRAGVGLAFAGGAVLVGVALLVTASVLRRWLAGAPISGDFDLVEVGVALASFAFLPLCVLRRGNIIIDSFTTRLPVRAQAALDALWSLVYAGVAAVLCWRLLLGGLDTVGSGTTSMMIGLPVGWVMVACSLTLGFLAVAALSVALGDRRRAERS
jgi:TRAP-type C4-dicarboxylate transport system permease small subunit